jgi:hypothetical protein
MLSDCCAGMIFHQNFLHAIPMNIGKTHMIRGADLGLPNLQTQQVN